MVTSEQRVPLGPNSADDTPLGPRQTKAPGSFVQAVDRALEILILLELEDRTVNEVAKILEVDDSTASRLIRTLRDRNFVVRDPISRMIRLGPRIGALGHAYTERLLDRRTIGPLLDRVADATGETVVLTAFDGQEAMYIDKRESQNSLRTSSRIGHRSPLHAGAAGKVILAFLPSREQERLLATHPLTRFTEHTITDRASLRAELDRIRLQGYAVSVEEIDHGVLGIAVPLHVANGQPEGSISVTGPLIRFGAARIQETLELLQELLDAHADDPG